MGYPGACLSSVIGTMTGCILNLKDVDKRVSIPKKSFMRALGKISVSLLLTETVFFVGQKLGLSVVGQGRFVGLVQFIILGCLGATIYLLSSFVFKVPQYILHKSTNEILSLLPGRRGN